MPKGLPKSMRRGAPQRQLIQQQVVKVRNLPVTVSGVTGIGFGAAAAAGLPEGNILLLGAVSYLTLSTADAGVIAAFTGAYSVGTAATADSTLSGAEVNIIPQTTLTAATAKVSPRTRGASTASGTVIDNTDKLLNVQINALIDDASISSNAPCLLNGEVIISYIVLADD